MEGQNFNSQGLQSRVISAYLLKRKPRLQQTTHLGTSFLIFKKNKIIFYENRLPPDDSHKISCLICYFLKKQQNLKLSSAANLGGALWVKMLLGKSEKCGRTILYFLNQNNHDSL